MGGDIELRIFGQDQCLARRQDVRGVFELLLRPGDLSFAAPETAKPGGIIATHGFETSKRPGGQDARALRGSCGNAAIRHGHRDPHGSPARFGRNFFSRCGGPSLMQAFFKIPNPVRRGAHPMAEDCAGLNGNGAAVA
jgi:hypothetical protein